MVRIVMKSEMRRTDIVRVAIHPAFRTLGVEMATTPAAPWLA